MSGEDGRFAGANLVGARIQGSLADANFAGITADGSDWSKTGTTNGFFEAIQLQDSSLKGANFQGAFLNRANFAMSKLQGANFRGAFLEETSWFGANIGGADFTGARV